MCKIKNNRGMTLMEVLVAVLILVLLVVAMGTGMNSGMEIYKEANFESNSAALAGIIDTALGDILRHAENIRKPEPDSYFTAPDGQVLANIEFVFTNAEYAVEDAYFYTGSSRDPAGILQLKSVRKTDAKYPMELVNSGAYPDLEITNFEITYSASGEAVYGGYFTVEYDIYSAKDSSNVKHIVTVIRHLNNG